MFNEEFDNDFLSIRVTDSSKNVPEVGCICCIPALVYFILKVLFLRCIFTAEKASNIHNQLKDLYQVYDNPII